MIQDCKIFRTFAPWKEIMKDFLISFFLPEGMTDWFDIVRVEEESNTGTRQADILYNSVLNIYLDERDNREGEQLGLKPNCFTEPTQVKDYPIRNRKVLLHVRRKCYLDADGRNIILNQYPLTADGTKVSVEFGLFLKIAMDTLPLTAASLARFFHIKGSEVERYYKHHLSEFTSWEQRGHAADWVLLARNMGERCSIDETSLCNEVYTILSNKDGHGRQGSIIAMVKGTKATVVSAIIKQVPLTERDGEVLILDGMADAGRANGSHERRRHACHPGRHRHFRAGTGHAPQGVAETAASWCALCRWGGSVSGRGTGAQQDRLGSLRHFGHTSMAHSLQRQFLPLPCGHLWLLSSAVFPRGPGTVARSTS